MARARVHENARETNCRLLCLLSSVTNPVVRARFFSPVAALLNSDARVLLSFGYQQHRSTGDQRTLSAGICDVTELNGYCARREMVLRVWITVLVCESMD